MMRSIFIVLGLWFSILANGQKAINLDEVNKYIGDSVKVCGQVYDAYYADRSENTPTFLNLGAKYPNQLLTVVIWGDVRKLFSVKPEDEYLNRNLCITGKIELYKGKPQIIITKKDQLILK